MTDQTRAVDLSSLSVSQALAMAPLMTGRAGRIALRDALVGNLRAMLGRTASAKADAQRLHDRLASPGEGGHAAVLRTVNALSRGGVVLSADRIEKVFSRLDRRSY